MSISGIDPDSGISVVFPYRESDRYRQENIGRALKFWNSCLKSITREFVMGASDPGPFNRSQAINRAVAGSSHDILIIADVDVTGEDVVDNIMFSLQDLRDGEVHLPYMEMKFLDENEEYSWTYENNVSAIQIMTRKTFEHIGGYDERYKGWGFEDNEFMAQVNDTDCLVIRHEGSITHHWHPVYWKFQDENYKYNSDLWNERMDRGHR